MIISFDYSTIVYTNYILNVLIIVQTKLIINLINKFNFQLVCALIYLSQFRLKIYYKFKKSNIVFNIFNRFFNETEKINITNSLNVNNFHNIATKNNIKKTLI